MGSFVYNNVSGNVVGGGRYGNFADSNSANAFRGFVEQGRTVANGHQQTRTFAAGNYTGSGSMTWTVTSGETTADTLVVNGNEATYYFEVLASTVGGTPSTDLRIALPAGIVATVRSTNTCRIVDNGTSGIGVCEIASGGTSISIFKDSTFTATWAASANTSVQGQLKFPINYTVN